MLEIKAVLPVVLLLCSAIMVSRYRIYFRVQELCESRGGRPSWAFRPNEPYGFCGRKATLNMLRHW